MISIHAEYFGCGKGLYKGVLIEISASTPNERKSKEHPLVGGLKDKFFSLKFCTYTRLTMERNLSCLILSLSTKLNMLC